MPMILKAKLAAKAAALAAGPLAGGFGWASLPPVAPHVAPSVAIIAVAPGPVSYRQAGDFARQGRPVNAPRVTLQVADRLVVMKRQVSETDYAHCVAERACQPRSNREAARADRPVTGVNWHDATAYAGWLSARTGEAWRLPTDVEWVHLAGERFADDAVAADDEAGAFARRWIAKYEQESGRGPPPDRRPQPFGHFGENGRGIADLAGNVWEWTDSCLVRQGLDPQGQPEGQATVNCGVRVVEGQHRSYMTDFIRDPRSGGCAVGVPPANLGFRLVHEERGAIARLVAPLLSRLRGRGGPSA